MTGRWRVRPADRPTRRETGAPISRRRQPPPTHCGAPRRNGRDLIIANADQRTSPYPHCCQRQRRRDSFAPRRERTFVCGLISSNSSQKARRQKLRFCTSSARYTACIASARAFPHVTGVFLIVVGPPTVPAQLSAAAARYYGKNYSFCRVAG